MRNLRHVGALLGESINIFVKIINGIEPKHSKINNSLWRRGSDLFVQSWCYCWCWSAEK